MTERSRPPRCPGPAYPSRRGSARAGAHRATRPGEAQLRSRRGGRARNARLVPCLPAPLPPRPVALPPTRSSRRARGQWAAAPRRRAGLSADGSGAPEAAGTCGAVAGLPRSGSGKRGSGSGRWVSGGAGSGAEPRASRLPPRNQRARSRSSGPRLRWDALGFLRGAPGPPSCPLCEHVLGVAERPPWERSFEGRPGERVRPSRAGAAPGRRQRCGAPVPAGCAQTRRGTERWAGRPPLGSGYWVSARDGLYASSFNPL